MELQDFPAFVRDLPEAELPFNGLKGWLLQSDSGQVLFNESAIELSIPRHSHGEQWGVVLSGRMDLTIGDQSQTYSSGDTYFIPSGVPHKAQIYPGFRAVDYFADKQRYCARKNGA